MGTRQQAYSFEISCKTHREISYGLRVLGSIRVITRLGAIAWLWAVADLWAVAGGLRVKRLGLRGGNHWSCGDGGGGSTHGRVYIRNIPSGNPSSPVVET